MAIWQFTFHLVPRVAAETIRGVSPLVIGAFRPVGTEDCDENQDPLNFWEGRRPQAHAAAVQALLPTRKSWSNEALMFGDEQGDGIELWDDAFRVRLDIRRYNEALARAVVGIAASADLVLVMGETGRLIAPEYAKLSREIAQSRAIKFALDPVGMLRLIEKEHE